MAESLKTFAAKNPLYTTGPKCSVCLLPKDVLEQVNEGPASGVGGTQITRWLQSLGFSHISRHRVDNHFRMKHERRPHR